MSSENYFYTVRLTGQYVTGKKGFLYFKGTLYVLPLLSKTNCKLEYVTTYMKTWVGVR